MIGWLSIKPLLVETLPTNFLLLRVIGSTSFCLNSCNLDGQGDIFHTDYLVSDFFIFIFFASKVLARTESQQLSYIVSGLKPYRIYNFTVSLCNSVGCVASASGAGQTLPAGKPVFMAMKNILCIYKPAPTKLNTFSRLDFIFVFCFFLLPHSSCLLLPLPF